MTAHVELDRNVRLHIYNTFANTSQPPTVEQTAIALGLTPAKVEAAYHRLVAGHVIVLRPDSNEVWIAMPFSAIPTPFRVTVGGQSWWANCAWDALGIAAMLGKDAHIATTCADTDVPLDLYVTDGQLQPTPAIAHFTVPAAHWWDAIGYT